MTIELGVLHVYALVITSYVCTHAFHMHHISIRINDNYTSIIYHTQPYKLQTFTPISTLILLSYLYGSYDAGLALWTHAGEHAETVDIKLYICVYDVYVVYISSNKYTVNGACTRRSSIYAYSNKSIHIVVYIYM